MMILIQADRALSEKRKEAIEQVIGGLPFAWVAPDRKDETMQALVQAALSNEEQNGSAFSEQAKELQNDAEKPEVLVYFSDLDRQSVMDLYGRLEQAGIGHVLCSMQTPFNETWSIEALRQELRSEAGYMSRRTELAELVEHADRERMLADADYRSCMLLAASLLQEDELSESMLDKALAVLHSFD